jgi:hypothetical protein
MRLELKIIVNLLLSSPMQLRGGERKLSKEADLHQYIIFQSSGEPVRRACLNFK